MTTMGKEWAARMVANYLAQGEWLAAMAYAQGYSDGDWSATSAELVARGEEIARERAGERDAA